MSSTTAPTASASATDLADLCDNEGGGDDLFGVRVASIFVILLGSLAGCLLPVITRRTKLKNFIPAAVFEYVLYSSPAI